MKKDLTLPARILISILFFVSAIAKMIDFTWTKGFSKTIWMFEKQLVDLDIATWCSAPYLARVIIAIEIAIAFAILQNHFIKKIVIPFNNYEHTYTTYKRNYFWFVLFNHPILCS